MKRLLHWFINLFRRKPKTKPAPTLSPHPYREHIEPPERVGGEPRIELRVDKRVEAVEVALRALDDAHLAALASKKQAEEAYAEARGTYNSLTGARGPCNSGYGNTRYSGLRHAVGDIQEPVTRTGRPYLPR